MTQEDKTVFEHLINRICGGIYLDISYCQVQSRIKSSKVASQKAKELSADPAFKASLGWYQNWKQHHSISFCTKATLAQRLPGNMLDTPCLVSLTWTRH